MILLNVCFFSCCSFKFYRQPKEKATQRAKCRCEGGLIISARPCDRGDVNR